MVKLISRFKYCFTPIFVQFVQCDSLCVCVQEALKFRQFGHFL